MIPIATNTLGSATASVTFSNLPQTYTDLILVTNLKSAVAKDLLYRINSDSGTNYSCRALSGTGTTVSSDSTTSSSYGYLDMYGYIEPGDGQMAISQWNNYSNTTTYKTVISRASNSANGVTMVVDMWRSTSAITSITLYAGTVGTNFSSGSTFTIYGVKAA
jgi:hypothetical protein